MQRQRGSVQASGSGILLRTVVADRGLIDKPLLTPHLEFRVLERRQVLLVSERFNTLLHGQIICDLVPLLDGRRSQSEIVGALACKHSAGEVRGALVALAERGYVVSGEYGMDRAKGAYWSALGCSPGWVLDRLANTRVALVGDAGPLARQLEAMGVVLDWECPTLTVHACADYLDTRINRLNRSRLGSGMPWMLVRAQGVRPLFGPVFLSAARPEGPCWACLAHRLRCHEEVHDFIRSPAGGGAAFRPFASDPVVLEAVCGLVAAEIAKWLVLGRHAPVHAQAISVSVDKMKSSLHRVVRRPQCSVCGDEALNRPDRPPTPVVLRRSPLCARTSGDSPRLVSPELTVARYRHLVSPISGVVKELLRNTEEGNSWLHVYSAGSNPAQRISSLNVLRRSLRSGSSGKGSTRAQAKASALCEAIERYCGKFHGDEIRERKRFSEYGPPCESLAIHPNDVQLFSEWQFDHSQEINASGHPFNFVPPRFVTDEPIDWSPVWSLTRGQHRYLPTALLYFFTTPPEVHRGSVLFADSNGCAAGNTVEEAVLHGFLELVERDAFAIWWYNRLRLAAVDICSFGDDYLSAAQDRYGRLGREVWVLDATSDLGIPVFVAVSRRADGGPENILFGAGAHIDPHVAALRAVCEMNQFLPLMASPEGTKALGADQHASRQWWEEGRLESHPYLAPAAGLASRVAADYPVHEASDAREAIEWCRTLVEAKGMELLVLDQTRPDIGLPVVRVVVPGLRHFWPRFAPGRLFQVPVETGMRDRPLKESELNPTPVLQ